MFKKLATLSGAGLLVLSGCGADTVTTLANSVIIPEDFEAAAVDHNENGLGAEDNTFAALVDPLGPVQAQLGLDLNALLADAVLQGTIAIGLDITSKNFANDNKKAAAVGYLADVTAPVFDGNDVLTVQGNEFAFNDVVISAGQITTGPSTFILALPFDPAAPTELPLNNAQLNGAINKDGTITNAALTGFINAVDFAAGLNSVGALLNNTAAADALLFNPAGAVTCGAVADCDAVAAGGFCTDTNGDAQNTGVCVEVGSTTEGVFNNGLIDLDDNGNGSIEIDFDEVGQAFVVNEIDELFDFTVADGVGASLLGGILFQLDLDPGIGGNDAAGIGVLVSTVPATK